MAYWKDVAILVKGTIVEDAEGYITQAETRREVLVNKKSATRSEFYTAKQAGDKIVLVLEVRGVDYRGEERVEFEGKPYEVVRAYTATGEKYELSCKEAPRRKSGGEAGKEDGP